MLLIILSHSFIPGPVRSAIAYPFLPEGILLCGSWVLHQGVHLSMKALYWPGISAQYEGETETMISVQTHPSALPHRHAECIQRFYGSFCSLCRMQNDNHRCIRPLLQTAYINFLIPALRFQLLLRFEQDCN